MKIGEIICQGDVYLEKISELPTKLKKKDKIIAYGEATGHKHQFQELDQNAVVFTDGTGQQYVQILKPTTLIHDEHWKAPVDEGVYVVRQQREFDVVEGIRQVMD